MVQFAENRILGIRAELDHALKLQVAQAIGSMPIISSWSIICFYPGGPGDCESGPEERGVHEAVGGRG